MHTAVHFAVRVYCCTRVSDASELCSQFLLQSSESKIHLSNLYLAHHSNQNTPRWHYYQWQRPSNKHSFLFNSCFLSNSLRQPEHCGTCGHTGTGAPRGKALLPAFVPPAAGPPLLPVRAQRPEPAGSGCAGARPAAWGGSAAGGMAGRPAASPFPSQWVFIAYGLRGFLSHQ